MRASFFAIAVICNVFFNCINNPTDNPVVLKPTVSEALKTKAANLGKVPTSIELNFKSGYWHIASGFNVDSLGDFRPYDGTWLKFRDNHEFTWGNKEEEKGYGAWGWDESKQYLTFLSDEHAFFIGEWATNNNGDVVVCVGSTPNNPRSTQFKIVRRHQKVVSE